MEPFERVRKDAPLARKKTEQSDAIERRLRPAVWQIDLSPPIDPCRSLR
jgi:hypothetical protein